MNQQKDSKIQFPSADNKPKEQENKQPGFFNMNPNKEEAKKNEQSSFPLFSNKPNENKSDSNNNFSNQPNQSAFAPSFKLNKEEKKEDKKRRKERIIPIK